MGQVNRTTNVIDRIKTIELQLRRLRSMVGLSSATIARGGLTLLQDAFLRMVDDLGVEILYIGPDDQGRQVLRVRREGGADVLYTAFTTTGNQFWRLADRFNRTVVADDTETGGLARPWLATPLYPLFTMAATSVYSYMNLPAASVSAETTLWKGRIPLVCHPYMQINGVWGQASGSNSTIYRLKLGGTQVGTWTVSGTIQESVKGPFNIGAHLDTAERTVELTAISTGTGLVACQIYGCTMRQTP